MNINPTNLTLPELIKLTIVISVIQWVLESIFKLIKAAFAWTMTHTWLKGIKYKKFND